MNDTEWKLIDRFKEPSSWSALAAGLGMLGISLPAGLVSAISMIGAGIAALLGFLLKEAPKAAVALFVAASLALTACSADQLKTAESKAVDYQKKIAAACELALPLAAVPYVGVYITAGCAGEQAIAKLALDPSSLDWVNGLVAKAKAVKV